MDELDQSRLAEDDSRRLLPRPVFDEAQRTSGYPACVSPRPARYRPSYGQVRVERLLGALSGSRRVSSSQGIGVAPSHTREIVEEAWWRRVDDR